jgi:hypothetical protein
MGSLLSATEAPWLAPKPIQTELQAKPGLHGTSPAYTYFDQPHVMPTVSKKSIQTALDEPQPVLFR